MKATAQSKECYYKNQKTTGLTHHQIEVLTADVLFKNNKVVYLDTFWCTDDTTGRNPIHGSEGELTGNNPWKIGRCTFSTIDKNHRFWQHWLEWDEYRKSKEGKEYSSRKKSLHFLEDYLK